MTQKIENFQEKKKAISEARKKLKNNGGRFTLQDVINNTDGIKMVDVPDETTQDDFKNKLLVSTMLLKDKHYSPKLCEDYYNVAKNKYPDTISVIKPVKNGLGFSFEKNGKEVEVFYCVYSQCMIQRIGDREREVAIYEV